MALFPSLYILFRRYASRKQSINIAGCTVATMHPKPHGGKEKNRASRSKFSLPLLSFLPPPQKNTKKQTRSALLALLA